MTCAEARPLLSDVAGPYIKAMNAMPRVVLGSIFTIALGLEMPSKVASPASSAASARIDGVPVRNFGIPSAARRQCSRPSRAPQ